MAIRVQCVNYDAIDPAAQARFWAEVLGWRITFEHEKEYVLEPPAGSPEDGIVPDILFLRVAADEPKALKNRVHMDLRPEDQSAEVARIESLGGKQVDIGQDATASWVVMTDPEGNEFCVLRAFTPEELASF
ncbi:VOC family protein [Kribbella italica]|uniref:Putative enzyme related to lactoylglutathione lyase n=1 Tax=Kribbella italica TaxID=1540520 RepID=A0A7W9MWI3_9ACTN|nr:VOC family protein [Kribbella italica]MBB5839071.1 putative enzyme related to lactoylglutathione lyase [Kribbella italica]